MTCCLGGRGLATFALLAALSGSARADTESPALLRARTAITASDYPTADVALREALASGTNGPADLVEIFRMAGIVSGSLGDAPAATEMFKRLLALAPNAVLPPKISPRITAAFQQAQAFYKTHGALRVKLETSDSPPAVILLVTSDPLSLIAAARTTIVADGKAVPPVQRTGTQRIELPLPPGARLELQVVVLDQHGNRLLELGSSDVPIAVVAGKQVLPSEPAPTSFTTSRKPTPHGQAIVDVTPQRRPIYAQPWLWSGVTVAFAATGAWFAYRTMQARDELEEILAASPNHQFDDARAVQMRLDRDAMLTNLAFGATAATAAVTVVLYLTSSRARGERPRTTVRPLRARGAAGVSMEMVF